VEGAGWLRIDWWSWVTNILIIGVLYPLAYYWMTTLAVGAHDVPLRASVIYLISGTVLLQSALGLVNPFDATRWIHAGRRRRGFTVCAFVWSGLSIALWALSLQRAKSFTLSVANQGYALWMALGIALVCSWLIEPVKS
jgi:hypothetical protein